MPLQSKSAFVIIRATQGSYIGNTTASQAVKAGSTPVPCSKKASTPLWGACLFLWEGSRTTQVQHPGGVLLPPVRKLVATSSTRLPYPAPKQRDSHRGVFLLSAGREQSPSQKSKIFASPAGPAPPLPATRTFPPLTGESALCTRGPLIKKEHTPVGVCFFCYMRVSSLTEWAVPPLNSMKLPLPWAASSDISSASKVKSLRTLG